MHSTLLVGSDLAGSNTLTDPCVSIGPSTYDNAESLQEAIPGIFPSCAVTRFIMTSQGISKENDTTDDLNGTCMDHSLLGHLFQM